MSNSIHVKEWRKRFKQKIINSFGGKCGICGYDKCNEVFHCHHLDPSKKEFSLGRMMGNPHKWEYVIPELKKCVLLCSNCHGEVHAGVTTIPYDIKMCDDSVIIEQQEKERKRLTNCPICNNLMSVHRITCSVECAARKSRTVDWDRVDLYDLWKIKKIPQTHIASTLGISGSAVRKRLIKLKLL